MFEQTKIRMRFTSRERYKSHLVCNLTSNDKMICRQEKKKIISMSKLKQ